MTIPVSNSHNFMLVDALTPPYDPTDRCMLSYSTYEELTESIETHRQNGSSMKLVSYNCNGITKYVDLAFFIEWIHSKNHHSCMNCRAPLSEDQIDDFVLKAEEFELSILKNKKIQLISAIEQLDQKIETFKPEPSLIHETIIGLQDYTIPSIKMEIQIVEIDLKFLKLELEDLKFKEAQIFERNRENESRIHYSNSLSVLEEIQNKISTTTNKVEEKEDLLKKLITEYQDSNKNLEKLKKYKDASNFQLLAKTSSLVGATLGLAISATTLGPYFALASVICGAAAAFKAKEPTKQLCYRLKNGI